MTYSSLSPGDIEGSSTPRASSRNRRRYVTRPKESGVAGNASFASSVINLVNTIVGAGVLAMPFAMSHMGMALGVFVILWSGMTAGFGLYLQTRCARYLERGSASFFALSQLTYPNAAVVFDAAIAIKCFGVAVSYLIIIGDLMPGVVEGFDPGHGGLDFLVQRQFWITAFMLVVIPLAFLKKLDSLKYTSIVALVSISYLIVLVVYHFSTGDETPADRGPIRYFETAGAVPVLSSFPVIVFAYTCHQNMFSILNEIKNNSHFRTTGVVIASIGTAASSYILVAITGYLTFGNSVSGNIVSMYSPTTASVIAKAAIVILVMFSYPLQIHPCRASVDAVLKWRPKKRPDAAAIAAGAAAPPGANSPSRTALLPGAAPHSSRPAAAMSEARFAAISSALIVLSYLAAMTISSLERVLAYVGSTGSTSISFILPGLFYYKISAPDSPLHQKLMKEDDDGDEEDDEEEVDGEGEGRTLLGGLVKKTMGRGAWNKGLVRKLSLVLAVYGMVVMIVCLITNTIFVAAH